MTLVASVPNSSTYMGSWDQTIVAHVRVKKMRFSDEVHEKELKADGSTRNDSRGSDSRVSRPGIGKPKRDMLTLSKVMAAKSRPDVRNLTF